MNFVFISLHPQVDPFSSLRHIWGDRTVLVLSLVTFLSYLPEAGQSTCFFVYLTLVLGEYSTVQYSTGGAVNLLLRIPHTRPR